MAWGPQKWVPLNQRDLVFGKNVNFWIFSLLLGLGLSFWKIRLLATFSYFHFQGAISKPRPRRSFWVVSRPIWTHILGSRTIFLRNGYIFFLFWGRFWKIHQLVTTFNLNLEGLIWSVWVSAFHRVVGRVSRLGNKLSRAIFVRPIFQSHGFWPLAPFLTNVTLNRASIVLQGNV